MEGNYNLRSPAVKRLMREAQELREKTEQFYAQPLEDNLFEWHFTIRGPADSEFENGIYHGRIILPPEYPMKPPSIILLTPSGRFETNKKICLSISGHHPESWMPSWSLRTALLAIIGFMPSHGNGAIGSLDYTPEERKKLAIKSSEWKCPHCGLNKDLVLPVTEASKELNREAKQLGSQINLQGEKPKTSDTPSTSPTETPPAESIPATTAAASSAPQTPPMPFPFPMMDPRQMPGFRFPNPAFPGMTGGTNSPYMMYPPPFVPPQMMFNPMMFPGMPPQQPGAPFPFIPPQMMFNPALTPGQQPPQLFPGSPAGLPMFPGFPGFAPPAPGVNGPAPGVTNPPAPGVNSPAPGVTNPPATGATNLVTTPSGFQPQPSVSAVPKTQNVDTSSTPQTSPTLPTTKLADTNPGTSTSHPNPSEPCPSTSLTAPAGATSSDNSFGGVSNPVTDSSSSTSVNSSTSVSNTATPATSSAAPLGAQTSGVGASAPDNDPVPSAHEIRQRRNRQTTPQVVTRVHQRADLPPESSTGRLGNLVLNIVVAFLIMCIVALLARRVYLLS